MTANPLGDETPQQIADRARKVDSEEWFAFDDHFFHGCCGCGLAHRVDVRRASDGAFKARFYRLDNLAEAFRQLPEVKTT